MKVRLVKKSGTESGFIARLRLMKSGILPAPRFKPTRKKNIA